MVIMNDLEWLMLSYYVIYYEKINIKIKGHAAQREGSFKTRWLDIRPTSPTSITDLQMLYSFCNVILSYNIIPRFFMFSISDDISYQMLCNVFWLYMSINTWSNTTTYYLLLYGIYDRQFPWLTEHLHQSYMENYLNNIIDYFKPNIKNI